MIPDGPESQSLFFDDTDNCKIIPHLFRSHNSKAGGRIAPPCFWPTPRSFCSFRRNIPKEHSEGTGQAQCRRRHCVGTAERFRSEYLSGKGTIIKTRGGRIAPPCFWLNRAGALDKPAGACYNQVQKHPVTKKVDILCRLF